MIVADQTFYAASLIKSKQIKKPAKRPRATNEEMLQRYNQLYQIIAEDSPMTVRQVFYQATVKGFIAKTEAGYSQVQVALADMRRKGKLPFSCIVDNTRWQRRPRTFDSISDALETTARHYRKSLWRNANCYVEFWLEKDALSGVIEPITFKYDVPLMIARGYSSLSFLYTAAEYIDLLDVPAFIYHLGDFDPSGVNAGEKIESTLRQYAPHAEIHFKRLAVTPEQITEYNLPTRPTKKTDSRAAKFDSEISVELDAIIPSVLRDIVEETINLHLPQAELKILQIAEANEREHFMNLAEIYSQQ
jgi:hypothetical protein